MNDSRKTWFIDLDGTLVLHKSHQSEQDYILPSTVDFFRNIVKEEDFVIITTGRSEGHRERIEKLFEDYKIKFDKILCDLPTGLRILINDKKPDGTITARSLNVERDEGIALESIDFI
jgi:histidinol phosphatase-like enzyme